MTITIRNLPSDPGVPAWNALLPPNRSYPVAEGNQTADFIVIGAGFAGLAAARRLHQLNPTSKIVILEARKIAEGPCGRNSGFMIDLPHNLGSRDYAGDENRDQVLTAMNREAVSFSSDAALEYDIPEEAFSRSGKVNAAATERGVTNNRNYADHLENMGEKFEFLDQTDMRTLCGSSYYQSGLFTPGTVMIQPASFSRSLASGLQRQGVMVCEDSPVVSLKRIGTGWGASTPKANFSANKVILAVNGHVESFGFFKQQLMHIFLYASMTRAMTPAETLNLGGQPNWGFTPADPLGTSVRRISGSGGDRIMIRNRFTWAPGRKVSGDKPDSIAHVHDRCFKARFPNLKDLSMEYRWGGLLCLSRNTSPAFGEIEADLYSACCQNGLGSVMGTLSGKLAAELASGGTSDSLQTMLDFPPPTRLPPEPFASIGANAVMRWSEFQCGREL
jgi:glycine/D-amino acid oxidase-like deaminating enzyme